MFGRRMLQNGARMIYQALADRWAVEATEQELGCSAIVFAPHFDDETLGCGGTIIKKKQRGADVAIVFLTDGSALHNNCMSPEALSTVRRKEGLAAAQVLGLDDGDVHALDFPDGRLTEEAEAAEDRVADILRMRMPEEVYLPYRHDRTADHVATNRIVSAAVRQVARPVVLLEYPVWFWEHWPWTDRSHLRRHHARRMFRESAGSAARFLGERRRRVYITDVADRKRKALEQHATQMRRQGTEANWPTLTDVWDGAFLECFFRDYELFVRRTFDPAADQRGHDNGALSHN